MKVPPKRKGNDAVLAGTATITAPSMKVPPKRKGNCSLRPPPKPGSPLNESPSEKEGKSKQTNLKHDLAITPLNESPSEKEGKYV